MYEPNFNIGPAAGMVRTLADVKKVAESAATEITVGTISEEVRTGNKPAEGPNGRVYYFDQESRASVNALGIPDHIGADGYGALLSEMVGIAHAAGKRLRVSVGSFKNDNELGRLAAMCYRLGVDEVEYNAGCPNIKDAGVPKQIPSYEPILLRNQLTVMKSYISGTVAVKLSPIDDYLIPTVARILNESAIVHRVVAVNTIPDHLMRLSDGTPALSYYGGDGALYHVGGLAGAPLKKEAQRVIRALNKHLHPDIVITAAGGIFTGEDAAEYQALGVTGYHIGTAYYEYGPRIFVDIAAGLV